MPVTAESPERVDLPAVEDDGLFRKVRAARCIERDVILVTAGREQHRVAGAHHPRHDEAGPRRLIL